MKVTIEEQIETLEINSLVYCKWHDANSGKGGWIHRNDVNIFDLVQCESAGFLASKTDNAIIVTTTLWREEDFMNGFIVIPKALILDLKHIEVK